MDYKQKAKQLEKDKRALLKQLSSLEHVHTDCNCHSHVPTPEEVASIGSLGDAIGLVLSIAVRPCTGAIFL